MRAPFLFLATCMNSRRPSVENAEFYGMGNFAQVAQYLLAVGGANVGDGIADGFRGFQILSKDIRFVRGENMIELCEHAGNVFVNVDEAVGFLGFVQLYGGEIHAVESGALVSVIDNPL